MEQKMSETKPKTNKKSLLIGLGIIACVCFYGLYETYIVKKEGLCTIATIYNIKKARGGRSFDFKYSLNGVEYYSMGTASYVKLSDNNERFFIYIMGNNPEKYKLTNIRVPDSITQAPYNGWKELPIPIPKE
jgi:hypothetical protein